VIDPRRFDPATEAAPMFQKPLRSGQRKLLNRHNRKSSDTLFGKQTILTHISLYRSALTYGFCPAFASLSVLAGCSRFIETVIPLIVL
jgi:hypothetical protein